MKILFSNKYINKIIKTAKTQDFNLYLDICNEYGKLSLCLDQTYRDENQIVVDVDFSIKMSEPFYSFLEMNYDPNIINFNRIIVLENQEKFVPFGVIQGQEFPREKLSNDEWQIVYSLWFDDIKVLVRRRIEEISREYKI